MKASETRHALVATHNLTDYAGSEIFTLELAIELRDMGWDVCIATFFPGEPMASEFEKLGFRILNILASDSKIRRTQFDLVWIHHAPVFYELCIARKISAAMVVFCSLSPFEPLEAVPAHMEKIDVLLSNSIENRNFIINSLGCDRDVGVFPNAVPKIYWAQDKRSHSAVLGNVAIISNHPAPEVLDAMNILAQMGVSVTHIGRGGTQILMSPKLLLSWDLVVTIGKTVPCCFALKVPVYCYDHFGGPGWLDEGNFDLASQNNFSGRGFASKTPEIIAQEIVEGYRNSLLKLDIYKKYAADFRNLGKNLELLLKQPRNPLPTQPDFADTCQTLKHHAQYMRLARILSVRESELSAYRRAISHIKSTLSWRLAAPFRVAYNLMRRIIGNG